MESKQSKSWKTHLWTVGEIDNRSHGLRVMAAPAVHRIWRSPSIRASCFSSVSVHLKTGFQQTGESSVNTT